ncbi:MAG: T9SS type A sorting domain-containing protein [Flavobacteriales bacterium]
MITYWKEYNPLALMLVWMFWMAAIASMAQDSSVTANENGWIPEVVLEFSAPNVQQLWNRAYWHEEITGKTMQGEIIEADVDFFEAAVMTVEGNLSVWKLSVKVEDAPALCVYFDQFHLPVGSQLTLESAAGVFNVPYVEGPVDYTENNDHGLWVSGEIPGEQVVIRYAQPIESIGTPQLNINGLGYFIRYLWLDGEYDLLTENNRGSDPCEVNVNCPEGEDWICQRDAVVRLRISQNGGIFLCSGAMVNNTAQDCRQLLLSSFHCADDMTDTDWALLKVRYNYEYFECESISSFNSHTRTGVYFLTSSDDAVGNNINGSDFLLMEVEDEIFGTWEPFYAGWDVSGSAPQEGVGIHHPAGDRKKISTYTNNASSSSAYHPQAHWRVTWVETETNHGVTEGGSSGSPLFDQNHRIVGTLTGGASYCTSPTQPDYYGKMSYHWDGNNPISEEEKLYNFLDPIGSGLEWLDGSYVTEFDTPCAEQSICGIVDIEENWLIQNPWQLRPNPANESVAIDWSGEIRAVEIRLYDNLGRFIKSMDVSGLEIPSFSVAALDAGLYYVTIQTAGGASATRKLMVE